MVVVGCGIWILWGMEFCEVSEICYCIEWLLMVILMLMVFVVDGGIFVVMIIGIG